MKVYVETALPCTPDEAWSEVQKSSLLMEVIRPIVTIRASDPEGLPECWQPTSTVRCKMFLLGVIPLGTRTLFFERIDPQAREIQSRETDPLIRRWDHLVRIREAGQGQTLYSDEIEIEAGALTWPVGLFARWFYRHRQRCWKHVARRIAQT